MIDLTTVSDESLIAEYRRRFCRSIGQPGEKLYGIRNGTETKTNRYERLVAKHGPLHVTEIVALADEYGIVLDGKKAKTLQVRDALSAAKQFTNFGSNVWGLTAPRNSGD